MPIYTGEIKVEPAWDYAGPFYHRYAHVAAGTQLEFLDRNNIIPHGGMHGYIDAAGSTVIPLEYDDAEDIPYRKNFKVAKSGKWGVYDKSGSLIAGTALFKKDAAALIKSLS